MSKVLVVYGTKSGCTVDIATAIGEALTAAGSDVEVVPAEKAGTPESYDAVVVGSGVRMGRWHQPVSDWVVANAGSLKTTPVAFYTCCLTMAQSPGKKPEVRAYTDSLIAETGVNPVDVGVFAGWFVPAKFSFVEGTVLKMMKAPQGDFRDLDAVKAWAAETAPKLGLS